MARLQCLLPVVCAPFFLAVRRAAEMKVDQGSKEHSRGQLWGFLQTDPSFVLTSLAVWEAAQTACSHASSIAHINSPKHTQTEAQTFNVEDTLTTSFFSFFLTFDVNNLLQPQRFPLFQTRTSVSNWLPPTSFSFQELMVKWIALGYQTVVDTAAFCVISPPFSHMPQMRRRILSNLLKSSVKGAINAIVWQQYNTTK